MAGDVSVDILQLLKGGSSSAGLKIAKIETTEPNPITLSFEGTKLALDLAIFEIPVDLYPLRKGDRFLVFPIVGNGNNRWGAITKLNGGVAFGTMQSADSLKIDGIEKTYTSSELIIPSYFAVGGSASQYSDSYTGKTSDDYLIAGDIRPLQAGDRVSLAATVDSNKIKYVVLNKY